MNPKPAAEERTTSATGDAPAAESSALTPERKQALLTWWKQVVSGQVVPEVLKPPPEVLETWRREEERFAREGLRNITANARRRILEDWTMQVLYGGQSIARFDTGQGTAILAVGWDEITWLLKSLPSERYHYVIDTPDVPPYGGSTVPPGSSHGH